MFSSITHPGSRQLLVRASKNVDLQGDVRPGPKMTLVSAAATQVRLIVWCHGCGEYRVGARLPC
jgi:hypothetical protein